jgi:bifunctional DNA-binding transcriptional regulator/antitoxin component of YhaV-PrlF toxin-antitoxin module
MTKLTVTSKGQVTLRKDLLQHLGVDQGQQVEVTKLPGGRIEVKAVKPAGTIESFIGMLADKTKKAATIEEIKRATERAWAGRR